MNETATALLSLSKLRPGSSAPSLSLCRESNGLVQLTTGSFVRHTVADQRSIVDFILADYAQHQLDLHGIRDRVATLYMDCFDEKERLAIGWAMHKKEK